MDKKSVLIIGGGISGITAAVEAAEAGCKVYLIEKRPYLGGQVARMNEYFPKLCPPYCGLEINFKRIRNSSRIEVITSAEVENLSGTAGDFTIELRLEPEYVNSSCTVCGDCSAVCPVEAKDSFNFGMSMHKAIDLPHELSYPNRFYLDDLVCQKESCKKCEEACNYDAINLEAAPGKRKIKVGSVLFCTGWEPYDPTNLKEYSWGESPDILNNVMMERVGAPNGPTSGKILKPSDGEPARKIAFVQCAGSRDENHLPYCSAVCCSASLKQAIYFTEQDPENRADIFYIDLRVSGRNEDFLKRVEENQQIRLIKGKASEVSLLEGSPVIEAEDILSGRKIREQYDMVVLATGVVPCIPGLKGIELDPDGFIAKDALENGLSAGGCCFEPKDVASSVRESTGLVINALQ
ncbi:MAG TPA: CoB--CoM heterodisulfide reductase iron-sulfur subunit A family protein [Bacteroides sp.]|nr:CoB--CoM heterodisulfide reductase iron-sulfur subunit A family protein [Bacteroides sp.]